MGLFGFRSPIYIRISNQSHLSQFQRIKRLESNDEDVYLTQALFNLMVSEFFYDYNHKDWKNVCLLIGEYFLGRKENSDRGRQKGERKESCIYYSVALGFCSGIAVIFLQSVQIILQFCESCLHNSKVQTFALWQTLIIDSCEFCQIEPILRYMCVFQKSKVIKELHRI